MTPTLDFVVRVLGTYDGRDKLLRTAYYALLVITGRMKSESLITKLVNLAKQLSAARTVGRRWNDLIMIKANLAHFENGVPQKERFEYFMNAVINVLYLFYHPVEHIAWLSGFELLPFNSSKWWSYTTLIWTAALVFSILRTLRTYSRLAVARYGALEGDSNDEATLKRRQVDEMWSLLMYLSDFAVAINYMPKGFLWAQTLPQWKVGAFGLVASLIGTMKLLQRLR